MIVIKINLNLVQIFSTYDYILINCWRKITHTKSSEGNFGFVISSNNLREDITQRPTCERKDSWKLGCNVNNPKNNSNSNDTNNVSCALNHVALIVAALKKKILKYSLTHAFAKTQNRC